MKSESIKELAAALSKAQGEIKNAKKDSKNPFFKSAYASLESVRDEVNPVFVDNGLSITQFPCMTEYMNHFGLKTTLMHVSGEWMEEIMDISPVMVHDRDKEGNIIHSYVTPQALGSAITYARRYALMGVAGIAPEDDDGNAGTGRVESETHTVVKDWKTPKVYLDTSDASPSIKNWKDFVCHLGGLKGVKLGDMTEDDLQKVYKYIVEKAKKTPEDNTLFAALSLAIGEKKKDSVPF